ncbi:hypothetical protein GS461_09755 [Rhodococcus hoagii]|nr:hypothetical protein [Prescottella equi]
MFLCVPPGLSSAFHNFFSIVLTAAWAANVGIPLVVALSAIVAAYVGIRKQISHDKATIENDQRRDRAATYASRLRDAARELNSIAGEVTHSQLTYSDLSKWMTALSAVYSELGRGSFRLEDGLGHKPELVSDVTACTSSIASRLQTWVLLANQPDCATIPIEARARTCAYLLELYARFLDTTAGQLEDWDGEMPVPPSGARIPSFPPEVFLPGGGTFMVAFGAEFILNSSSQSRAEDSEAQLDSQRILFSSIAKRMADQLGQFKFV